jgi:1,4-alpha-glucan branching enzyme
LKDLNALYKNHTSLYEQNFSGEGFEWIDFNDTTNCVLAWVRKDTTGGFLIFVCNFTPVVRENYRIGVPQMGYYSEVFNSDSSKYAGSNVCNGDLQTAPISRHGRTHSVSLVLPPLAAIVLRRVGNYM